MQPARWVSLLKWNGAGPATIRKFRIVQREGKPTVLDNGVLSVTLLV
jgi:hypothetical protein